MINIPPFCEFYRKGGEKKEIFLPVMLSSDHRVLISSAQLIKDGQRVISVPVEVQ